jgi:O-antigen biosynthesis protein WbqV
MTNSLGTINVADACARHGAGAMVLVSTDKAVNPTSIMGVSKRLAEIYCQALDLDREAAGSTRFVTVRFGNVLGSTGSVVPLFQKQLASGGPLTVTHPDMTRYFMTLREAVELILQASALGSEGPSSNSRREGKIFVLDMGDPVRIVDLARQMIRLAGLKPDVDVEIEIIGPRPGEKLFEEVLHESESLVATSCDGILLAAPRTTDLVVIRNAAEHLQRACTAADEDAVLTIIREFVPEYQETGGGDAAAATG